MQTKELKERTKEEQEVIDYLNSNIETPPNFITQEDICSKCKKRICECCEGEKECPYDYDNECPVLREWEESQKIIESKEESFHIEKIKGENLFLNHNGIMGVTFPLPLEFFNKYYKRLNEEKFRRIKSNPFLLVYEREKDHDLILIGNKEKGFTEYHKFYLDQILEIVTDPTFYYALNKPFLIITKDFIYLLSPRVDDSNEGNTLEDYEESGWIPYENNK